MSLIISTPVGRFRRVIDRKSVYHLWECPACGAWAALSLAQWHGLVSTACSCGRYHETHNFGAALQAALIAAELTNGHGYRAD